MKSVSTLRIHSLISLVNQIRYENDAVMPHDLNLVVAVEILMILKHHLPVVAIYSDPRMLMT